MKLTIKLSITLAIVALIGYGMYSDRPVDPVNEIQLQLSHTADTLGVWYDGEDNGHISCDTGLPHGVSTGIDRNMRISINPVNLNHSEIKGK